MNKFDLTFNYRSGNNTHYSAVEFEIYHTNAGKLEHAKDEQGVFKFIKDARQFIRIENDIINLNLVEHIHLTRSSE